MKKGYSRSHDHTYDPKLDEKEKKEFLKRTIYTLARRKVPKNSSHSRKRLKRPYETSKLEATL